MQSRTQSKRPVGRNRDTLTVFSSEPEAGRLDVLQKRSADVLTLLSALGSNTCFLCCICSIWAAYLITRRRCLESGPWHGHRSEWTCKPNLLFLHNEFIATPFAIITSSQRKHPRITDHYLLTLLNFLLSTLPLPMLAFKHLWLNYHPCKINEQINKLPCLILVPTCHSVLLRRFKVSLWYENKSCEKQTNKKRSINMFLTVILYICFFFFL